VLTHLLQSGCTATRVYSINPSIKPSRWLLGQLLLVQTHMHAECVKDVHCSEHHSHFSSPDC
jgi:hypothetical protein